MSALTDAGKRARLAQAALAARYPAARTALAYASPWQLLVAVVLSAQCTDARVNMVTPNLFSRWPGPAELAAAGQAELEEAIRSIGFFRQKAKNLRAAARMVCANFNGRVPQSMAELVRLPGVARKTANVVLHGAFGICEGIAVDTHVKRLSFRLGLTGETDPDRVERDLLPLFPKEEWGNVNSRMVLFGREVCTARNPACADCVMAAFCPRLEPKAARQKKVQP